MGEKWHYATYDLHTGRLVQESTVEFRGQAPESFDDLRDRVVADGLGFLALDPNDPPLDDISHWRARDGGLTNTPVDMIADWTARYEAAQAVVTALEARRPAGVDLAQVDAEIAASAAQEKNTP